jgi:predicted O-linked N-acetylglucosamine transferase (SPINDLY family)
VLASPDREDDPAATVGIVSFPLAYHGLNDRPLQTKLARALLGLSPQLASARARPRARAVRRRIGIASAHLYEHSIGRTSRGLFAALPRDATEVIAVNLGTPPDDAISRRIRAEADDYVIVDRDLGRAREQVAALDLDVLFYQDVGFEPLAYYLAFSRLAPVQCTSFGHPVTTGIPTMDWFVSSTAYEPEDAADHYRERLFLLRDVPVLAYYVRPVRAPGGPTRREFGFDDGEHVHLCPQALFKVHPDFDALVGGILRSDPLGRVVFVEGYVPGRSRLLLDRLRRSIPDVVERVAFVPPAGGSTFLDLLAAADVILDTPHFNGMNTTLEAFAVGAPVVTWPGRFQRGRHVQAMYRAMGIHDAIARDFADYVRIAVDLGTDASRRRDLSGRIGACSGRLYEDRRFIDELVRFFDAACAATPVR